MAPSDGMLLVDSSEVFVREVREIESNTEETLFNGSSPKNVSRMSTYIRRTLFTTRAMLR